MKYALSKGILQFSIVSATTAIALTATTNAWSANLSFVSSRAALGANDIVNWNPLPNNTSPNNPITVNSVDPAPANFSIQSVGGLTVTGTQGGQFGPTRPNVRQQSSTPYTITTIDSLGNVVPGNSPSPGNAVFQGESFIDTGVWNGNFQGGDYVYWNNNGSGRLELSFSTPVSAVGTQLDSLFYHGTGLTGVTPFRGTITAFYGSGPSATSSTFAADGTTSALANGSATFYGVSSNSADITSVVFDTFDIPEGNSYFNYAINSVSIRTTAQAVPEPFSILGTLFGGAAALKMRRKFKATNKL
jgi:hypothetical protein